MPIKNDDFQFGTSEYEIFNKLTRLKFRKSTEPDNILSRLLKEGALWLCDSLAKVFDRSIKETTFLSFFKTAKVCPILKAAPSIGDLRPMSVLTVLSKVFESLALDRMKCSLIKLYGAQQHAFSPLGSTTSALIDIVEGVSSRLNSRGFMVNVTCLDLTKAFDMLQHNCLLNTLNVEGVDHGFLR